MNDEPQNPLPPPSPYSRPAGRSLGRAPVETSAPPSEPGRGTVRVTAPDLARRKQMDLSRGRVVLAAGGFMLLFGLVALKLSMATVLDPVLPRPQEPNRAKLAAEASFRAPITDRNGELLAVSLPMTALYARPQEIHNAPEVADRLAKILPQLNRDRIFERISSDKQFVYLARAITPREQALVNNLGIPGIYFENAERRFYPQGRAAVHVLGTVDVDGNGVSGVEKEFDDQLRIEHKPVRLSIDVRVETALREAVQSAITSFNGIGGVGIVMDVNTAEVIGMVSLPDYDADNIGASTADERFNRAVSGVYEPGSTFKLMTASMTLDRGLAHVWNSFDAAHDLRFGRFVIHDFEGKHRWLSFPEVLIFSSNLGAAHMAMLNGPARQRSFLEKMGMLRKLDVELPEAARPIAPSARNWRDVNMVTISYGHGIAVTPLHVITGVSAIVNGGIRHEPTILAVPNGVERPGQRVISEQTSETMRKLMRLVVTQGSGRNAEVPGYFLGGKTGTAQKLDPRGGYAMNQRVSAFVGAFPINAPRYAVYVMVDDPKPNAHSYGFATAGWVAAPAAKTVITRVAPILGLVPETDPDRVQAIQQAIFLPAQPGKPPGPAQAAKVPTSAEISSAADAPPPDPSQGPAANTAPQRGSNAVGLTPAQPRLTPGSGPLRRTDYRPAPNTTRPGGEQAARESREREARLTAERARETNLAAERARETSLAAR